MNLKKTYTKLCAPAKLYLKLAVVSVIITMLLNMGKPYEYSLGDFTAKLTFNNLYVVAIQALYVLGWTWILNKFCRWGWTPLSWFLVLLPFVLFFLGLGIFMLIMMIRHGPRAPNFALN